MDRLPLKQLITRGQWQRAVNMAEACLRYRFHHAVTLRGSGVEINVGRCIAMVANGREQGFTPQDSEVVKILEDIDHVVAR